MLRTLGIDAHFLPLGWDPESRILKPRRRVPAHPRFSGLVGSDRSLPGRSDWMERPIDILFVGTLSERRTGLLAHAAMALAQHRCFMHLPPSDRPLLAGEADSLSGRDMADLCRRAKIVLNIHTTVGHIGNYIKEIQVFNVPYLFPAGSDIYYKVVNQRDSVFYKFFDNEYNKTNLKLLGMYEEGIQAWSSRKPLRRPEDLKGLKIRVMPSPLIAEAYRILGANPTPIPFGEVYSSLQLGMVDAQENPINTIWDMKFFEVQDYITSGYSYHLASGTGANL